MLSRKSVSPPGRGVRQVDSTVRIGGPLGRKGSNYRALGIVLITIFKGTHDKDKNFR